MISAATLPLLAQYLTTLADAIQKSNAPLRDLAYTLTATRRREDERIAFVASSRSELGKNFWALCLCWAKKLQTRSRIVLSRDERFVATSALSSRDKSGGRQYTFGIFAINFPDSGPGSKLLPR